MSYLDSDILNSYYYRFILESKSRDVLLRLFDKVLIGNNIYYGDGQLVSNIKLSTLSISAGISQSKLEDGIEKLNEIGAIIILPRLHKNNRYLVGFRPAEGTNRLYLINHLVDCYENKLSEEMEYLIANREGPKSFPTPKTPSNYFLKPEYRQFIIENCDNPVKLLNAKVYNNKTLPELLFGSNCVYKKPLPIAKKLVVHGYAKV